MLLLSLHEAPPNTGQVSLSVCVWYMSLGITSTHRPVLSRYDFCQVYLEHHICVQSLAGAGLAPDSLIMFDSFIFKLSL